MYKRPNGNTEQLSFYRKMAELQDKLRKSEEERTILEHKFSDMVRGGRARSDDRLSILRQEYANILEREKRRRARNEKVMEALENIDRHTAVINAKTEHLKLMRRQFDSYMLKMYPEFKISRKNVHEVQQSVSYEPVQTTYRSNQPDRQWQSPYLNKPHQHQNFSEQLFNSRLQDPIYSFQRREESIYAKPASSPMNLSRHYQGHDDSDQGSLLYTSINDVKPLNLTMEDSGRLSTGMRNVEEGLNKLILDSAERLPAEELGKESKMMEKLSKITQEVLRKESSFEAEEEDGVPPRCQSSLGMIEKSLNLHEETRKLLEDTSPRRLEDVLAVVEEDKEEIAVPVLIEEEEDILYAESTIDPFPDASEVSEVVTQDVTESQGHLDYVQNITEAPAQVEVASPEVVLADEQQYSNISAEDVPQTMRQPEQEFAVPVQEEEVGQNPAIEYQYEGFSQEQQEPQYYQNNDGQQENLSTEPPAGQNMYGNDESSESTNQLVEQPGLEPQQVVDNDGFREYELQQNPVEYQEDVDTLAEYDSSEMTATSMPQQPVQQEKVAEYDVQSLNQTSTSDEVEQQIADIMTHAPTSALPPAPPGKTGVSPSSSWGKLKNLGTTGALRTKPGSPTNSRAGSAKSSPGSKKSTTPPNKSPSNRSPNSSSGTRSPATKKPTPTKK